MSAPVFTPIFSYPGTGANVSPLPAGQWTSVGINGPGGLPTFDQLQVLNNLITTTTEVQADGQATTIGALPNNQYVSVQLEALASTGVVFLYLRASEFLQTAYVLFITGPFNDDTQATYGIFALGDEGASDLYDWVVNDPILVQQGDNIILGVDGANTGNGQIYFYHNGVKIFQGSLNANPDASQMNAGGQAGLQLADTTADTPSSSDIGTRNFVAGGFNAGVTSGTGNVAGYGTDISTSGEITTNPAAETNSNRTAVIGTNRGSRFIG